MTKQNDKKVLFSLIRNDNQVDLNLLAYTPEFNINNFSAKKYDVIELDVDGGALVLDENGQEFLLPEADFDVALYGEASNGTFYYNIKNINIKPVKLFEIIKDSEVHNVYGFDVIQVMYEFKDGSVWCYSDNEINSYCKLDYEDLIELSSPYGCYNLTDMNKESFSKLATKEEVTMSQNMKNLASSLEAIEQEIGLEELSQLLANSLLSCSARLVGDSSNNWTVKTDFVNGEVVATTDKALSK
jgi:hypothetical protein